jgi:hypothetical protein
MQHILAKQALVTLAMNVPHTMTNTHAHDGEQKVSVKSKSEHARQAHMRNIFNTSCPSH